MALTKDFKKNVVERVSRDPAFVASLFDDATTQFLNGESESARLILRDLINATVGFEELASEMTTPPKSLHRMLSRSGNPSMDNLAKIFSAMRQLLELEVEVHSTKQSAKLSKKSKRP